MKADLTEPMVHLRPFLVMIVMVQIVLNVMQTEPVQFPEMPPESSIERKTETAAAEATEKENDRQSALEVPRAGRMILVETGVTIDVTIDAMIADATTGEKIAERTIGEMTTAPETIPNGIAGTLVVTRVESANVLRTVATTVQGIREILEITEIAERTEAAGMTGMTAGGHEAIATPEIGTAADKTNTAGIDYIKKHVVFNCIL